MRRILALATVLFVAIVLVVRVWAAPPVKALEGYWMGIDPVDGGDQRRSFVQQEDGTVSAVGRDSFLRLCDDSDRGVVSFEDGTFVDKRTVATDNLKLTCFGNGAVLILKARYDLVNANMIVEHLTTQEGAEIQSMVLHKVSR